MQLNSVNIFSHSFLFLSTCCLFLTLCVWFKFALPLCFWGFFGAVTAIASGSDKLLGVPAGNRIWHIYNAKQMRTFQAELRCFPFRYHELISCHFHNVTCCSCLCRNYEIIGVLSGIKLIINIQPKRCKPRWSRNLRCKMYNNHKSSMEKEVTIING